MLFPFSAAMMEPPTGLDRPWKDEIVYQIFPRSYRDSNGDGIGDLKGIEEGLPTIHELGCTAILVNPIVKARVYHNYFADDFYTVDPEFGTNEDLTRLVSKAHSLGIKVLIDMETQYVADEHPWMKAAKAKPGGREHRRLDDPGGKADWKPLKWYDGKEVAFTALKMTHPDVIREQKSVFVHWAKLGVDGFRIDHMMDDLDWRGEYTGLVKKVWDPVITSVRQVNANAFFVGEQADWESYGDIRCIIRDGKADAVFGFMFRKAAMTFDKVIIQKMLRNNAFYIPRAKHQLTFLENHDMERLGSIQQDSRKVRLAAALLLLSQGTPTLYYGQELGMKGLQNQWGSDGNDIPVRLAYRWNSTLDTTVTALWYRDSGPWWSSEFSSDHDGISLEEQRAESTSLWTFYKELIMLRKANPALGHGSQEVPFTKDPADLHLIRTAGGQTIHIHLNMSAEPMEINLKPGAIDLLTEGRMEGLTRLPPWGFGVYQTPKEG